MSIILTVIKGLALVTKFMRAADMFSSDKALGDMFDFTFSFKGSKNQLLKK